jgi:hypothetical protein
VRAVGAAGLSAVRRRAARAVLCLSALAALVPAGCGYTTRSFVNEYARTVAVPVFDNRTRRHDLEWEVTRAVVERIHDRTHLRVVDPGDQPDLVLTGTLRDVDEDVLARRRFQRVRESAVFVVAEVEVVDRRTGAVVVPRQRVAERESFTPVLGEDLRTAREAAVRELAERVVHRLEQGW